MIALWRDSQDSFPESSVTGWQAGENDQEMCVLVDFYGFYSFPLIQM